MVYPEVLRGGKGIAERWPNPSLTTVSEVMDALRSSDSAITKQREHFKGAHKRANMPAFCRPLLYVTTNKGSGATVSDSDTAHAPYKGGEPALDCATPRTPQFALSDHELRSVCSPPATFASLLGLPPLCFDTAPLNEDKLDTPDLQPTRISKFPTGGSPQLIPTKLPSFAPSHKAAFGSEAFDGSDSCFSVFSVASDHDCETDLDEDQLEHVYERGVSVAAT
eukprot:gb/GEZN01013619.1/.p1 GENE.gb/GEZN01013619.1/~~gb/GEZN01013619.1/.p1  ORF type:complete len:223 (-),score=19.85 gb/GEZN01013619.1/:265-933(-)